MTTDTINNKHKGFGSMTTEQRREIASMGGRASHAQGTAHQWTSEQAREAGRKGGRISRRGPSKHKTKKD